MRNFFAFCRDLPDAQFIHPGGKGFASWRERVQYWRAGDMLPAIYWLYNHTGDAWLLDLAARFYACIEPPKDEWLDHHVVNFTQRFAYPGIYHQQTGADWVSTGGF